MVAGYFRQNGINTGFEYSSGKFRAVAYPGSSETIPQALSDTSLLVGWATGLGSNQSFVFRQANYDVITIPGATDAFVMGINPKGNALVGYYDTFSGLMGFVYRPSQGTQRTISFPNAFATIAHGINSGGTVVGYFIDTNSKTHGFTVTPSN